MDRRHVGEARHEEGTPLGHGEHAVLDGHGSEALAGRVLAHGQEVPAAVRPGGRLLLDDRLGEGAVVPEQVDRRQVAGEPHAAQQPVEDAVAQPRPRAALAVIAQSKTSVTASSVSKVVK